MNKKIKFVISGGTVSLFFCLFGCGTPNPVETQIMNSEFSAKARAIKESSSSEQEVTQRLSELMDSYGIKHLSNDKDAFRDADLNNFPIPPKNTSISAAITRTDEKPHLGKTTVEFNYQYAGLKWLTYNVRRPFLYTYDVPAYNSITVRASNPSSSVVDPFLVIYSVNNGDPSSDFTLQQQLSVLSYNDDYTGYLPYSSWYNNSSSIQKVTVLMFAYSAQSAGTVTVTVTLAGTPYNYTSYYLPGTAMFWDMGYIGGSGQTFSKPNSWQQNPTNNACLATSGYYNSYFANRFTWGSKAASSNGDTYIWAFNFSQGRGMANDDIASGDYTSGLSNWWDSWLTMPMGNHYPSFILAAGYGNSGTANFLECSQYLVQ